MSEETVETTPKRKGPTPNPISAYNKARARAEKARKAAERCHRIAAELEEAETAEAAAYTDLQAALAGVPLPGRDAA